MVPKISAMNELAAARARITELEQQLASEICRRVEKPTCFEPFFLHAVQTMLLLDENAVILDINPAGAAGVKKSRGSIRGQFFGQVFDCLNSAGGGVCGTAGQCPECPVRKVVNQVLLDNSPAHDLDIGLTVIRQGVAQALDRQVSVIPVSRGESPMVLLIMSNSTEHKQVRQALYQRERMLSLAAMIALELLQAPDPEQVLSGVLARLGEGTDMDRAYIFKNHRDVATGKLLCSQICEWSRPGVAPQIDYPLLQNLCYADHIPHWFEAMAAGRTVRGLTGEFLGQERALLERLDIKGVLLVPIQVADGFWGQLGFDAVRSTPIWSSAEESVLRIVATAIGAAFTRRAGEQTIVEQNALLKGVFQSIPVAITVWDSEGRLLQANQGFFDLHGYPAEAIGKLSDWFSRVYQEPRLRDTIIADWQKSREEKTTIREYPIVCRDGSVKQVEFRAAFLANGNAIVSMADMSRRREAEQEIKTFKTISDRALHGNVITDLAGKLLYLNASFAAMHGYQVEELIGRHFSVFHNQRQMITARGAFETALREGQCNSIEVWHQHRDGTEFPMLMTIVVVGDEDGAPRYLAATAIDLTDRKKAEEELRAKSEELERYFLSSLDLLCIANANGEFVRLNPEWENVLGYAIEELEGRVFLDFVHQDDQEATRAAIATLAEQEQVLNFENRYRCKDGSYRWIEWRSRPLGETIYAVARDITQRKEAEQALRASEETFRNIVQASPMGIFLYRLEEDDRLVFAGANPAADRLLGTDNSRFIGMTIEAAFPPLQYTEIPDRYRRAARQGTSWHAEEFNYDHDGIAGAFEVYAFQMAPGRTAVLFNDITERKRAEDDRAKLQERLNQAQKMESLGTLAGGVAHDFNNLLQVMSGNIELLLLNRDKGHPEQRRLKNLAGAIERAAHLVRQLLFFGRKSEGQRRPVDMNQEVGEAVKILERTIPRMVTIVTCLDDTIPSISADPTQVEQVLLNLASNAADAMANGGQLTIKTAFASLDREQARRRGMESGSYVVMEVLDTGHGMTSDIVEQIFDPFFTTKEVGKGTGLGLASVYGIVKGNGGHIFCASEPGRGTQFKTYWPSLPEPGELEAAEPPVATIPRGDLETILVVDDEDEIRALTRETLLDFDYNVLQAASGEEAVAIYGQRGRSIDLVMLDLNMPGMGGYQCLQELLRIDNQVLVLVASGYSVEGQAAEIMSKGAAGFIGKPYRLNELLMKVREVLGGDTRQKR